MHAHCTDSRKPRRKEEPIIHHSETTTIYMLICIYPVVFYAHNIQNWEHIINVTLYPYITSIMCIPHMMKYLWKMTLIGRS